MMRALLLAALILTMTPSHAEGQGLPFIISIIDWQRETLERQRREYRSAAEQHEVLFCVESWTKSSQSNGVERIAITSIRRERADRQNRIADVGSSCLGDDGNPLPTLHTHSDGNCQLSPSDLITIVARGAAFDGVQCGERHFVWAFAWQVAAIATSVERDRLDRAAPPPP